MKNDNYLKLLPTGWQLSSKVNLKSGAQSYVKVVEDNSGRLGVFKVIKDSNNALSIKRFRRELEILTNSEYKHKNIVDILDYSKDGNTLWYISEYGLSFTEYWSDKRLELIEDGNGLLRHAIDFMEQLLSGLAILHSKGVTHRDIKPDNIIINQQDGRAFPVLIDFGVAYNYQEDRLTPLDSAVGNIRFSPDQMMNRMDNVPPWLDVFQMSQLLIWMISERPIKQWNRPLDWKWVEYPSTLSTSNVMSIRAITASCAEESISPKNAEQFLSIIQTLFPTGQENEISEVKLDINTIKEGISTGRSQQLYRIANDLRIVNASYPIIQKTYEELRSLFLNDLDVLLKEKLVRITRNDSFSDFYARIAENSFSSPDQPLLEIECGDSSSQKFHFRFFCIVDLPSITQNRTKLNRSVDSNIFILVFQMYAHLNRGQDFPGKTIYMTHEKNGEMTVRDDKMKFIRKIGHINEIRMEILGWINTKECWDAIQKDR